MRRLIPVIVGLGLVGAAGAAAVWLSERRKHEVFPASQAPLLLNPLRHRIMPVGKTLERFGLALGQTVLELGPGPGYYTIDASRMVGSNGRLLCLDLQRGMLDLLGTRLGETRASNVEMIVADAMHLPLRGESLDGGFLVTVLGEVPDQEAAVAELRRVMKPGGFVGFSESLGDPDIVFLGRLRRLCGDAGFIESGHWRNPLGYTIVFRSPG